MSLLTLLMTQHPKLPLKRKTYLRVGAVILLHTHESAGICVENASAIPNYIPM